MNRPRSLVIAALIGVLLVAAAWPAQATTWGPDGFGYTWADSDEPYVDTLVPAYTPTDRRALGFSGDDTVIQVPLPASVFPTGFPFYGVRYNTLWWSSNGWISFVNPGTNANYSTTAIPAAGIPDATIAFFWKDLTLETTLPAANTGPTTGNSAFVLYMKADSIFRPASPAELYVILYPNGMIKTVYGTGSLAAHQANSVTGMGIENATGTVGLPRMNVGLGLNNATFRDNYAVVYFPPPSLNCASNVSPLSCPTTGAPFNNTGGGNNVVSYSCTGGTWNGNEKVFNLTVSSLADLTIRLNNTDGRNRGLFFMRGGCNEYSGCEVGGGTTVSPRYVSAGNYYVVVDGATATDNGNFTIDVSCVDVGTNLPCGTTLAAQSTSGTGVLTNWSCAAAQGGPEQTYKVTVPQISTVTARLTNKTNPNLRMMLSDSVGFNTTLPPCLATDPNTIQAWGLGPGTYYVTVDAPSGVSGSYDVSVSCDHRMVCNSPPVIDLSNPTTVFGDTSMSTNLIDTYYCSNSAFNLPGVIGNYTGGEDIYQFTVTAPTSVSFQLTSQVSGMRVLVLSNCYEGSCVQEGGCMDTLNPGTYYLVVDGQNGAQGPYSLTPVILPSQTYNRWYQCPEAPGGGQTPADISRQVWSFNSGSYCGTGCDFSLFAVVECGTEFHIPFWDVETGHMQIFDIFRNQFLNITATNDLPTNGPPRPPCTSWRTVNGTYVEWLDRGCPLSAGSDCWTNQVVQDVSFQGTPNVCGVYRLDFINWGGFAWDVYANCTADRTPQYYLFRDLCSALSNYNPRPEIGFDPVTFTIDNSQCGSMISRGTFTVENIGCQPVASYEISIEQAPPEPPNPQIMRVNVLAGERQVIPWSYNLTGFPGNLIFKVDPANTTAECSENLGSVVSCGTNSSLVRQVPLVTCPQSCRTVAEAGDPQTLCEGAPVRLDGSGSSFTCVLGTAERQYRWEDVLGNPIPGCDWSTTPTCDVPAGNVAVGTNLYNLRTRCFGDAPPCEQQSSTIVDVIPNIVPPSLGNVLRANREQTTVLFSWASIVGSPVSAYRMYMSPDRALPTGNRSLMVQLPATATTASHDGGVILPPFPVNYYQAVGVSCLGDIEGPY